MRNLAIVGLNVRAQLNVAVNVALAGRLRVNAICCDPLMSSAHFPVMSGCPLPDDLPLPAHSRVRIRFVDEAESTLRDFDAFELSHKLLLTGCAKLGPSQRQHCSVRDADVCADSPGLLPPRRRPPCCGALSRSLADDP